MTSDAFRRIALGLPGAIEASHMNHPDFRTAHGRIFATLTEDEKRGMASLTPDQQADFMTRAPQTFTPAAGAWGRGGATMIDLKTADAELVGEAVTLAWQRVSAIRASKSRPKAKPAAKAARAAQRRPSRRR
jgi:hypothetical protein